MNHLPNTTCLGTNCYPTKVRVSTVRYCSRTKEVSCYRSNPRISYLALASKSLNRSPARHHLLGPPATVWLPDNNRYRMIRVMAWEATLFHTASLSKAMPGTGREEGRSSNKSYPSMNPTQPKGDDRSLLSCTAFVGEIFPSSQEAMSCTFERWCDVLFWDLLPKTIPHTEQLE